MTKKIFLALVPVILAMPSGCTWVPQNSWVGFLHTDPTVETASAAMVREDPVSTRLAAAAEKAAAALEVMSRVEQARSPVDVPAMVFDPPPELKQTITVSWVGPVESVTRLLAEVAGYTYTSIGHTPPVPVVVDVNASEQPLVDVLRDIGLQMGRAADVSVNAQARRIEVRYAPVSASR